MNQETKLCSKCKKEKPKEEFYRMPTAKSGRHSHCKDCHGKPKKKDIDPYRFF